MIMHDYAREKLIIVELSRVCFAGFDIHRSCILNFFNMYTMVLGSHFALSFALVLTTLHSAWSREQVLFDFGWRFYLGDLANFAMCPENSFPTNLSNVECMGLSESTAKNSDDCRGSCCADVMCAIWQYADTQGCWIGNSHDCDHPSDVWVGGGRPVPAPQPPPAKNGPTSRDYDDSSWELVDAPHDGIISGTYNESGIRGQGYLPKNITWYRKHFNLPTDWKGMSIWVYFEGVFRSSLIYLNGQQLAFHDSGYTSFSVPLDTASDIYYGDGKENENVISVRATYESESGWWYEGCGIYRHVYLVATDQVHILPDSVYGASNITGKIIAHDPNDLSKGMYADKVSFYPRAEVVESEMSVSVQFTLYDSNGLQVGQKTIAKPSKQYKQRQESVLSLENVELWSNLRPYFYTLQAEVMSGSTIFDSVNVTIGVRQARWDANTGFYLNGVPFIWRGFNNHNNFAGVGMAVPDRVDLFRGQSMRAVGANAWRMSHNPPIPVMLDILDRLGIVVWDENRQFGDEDTWIINQRDMVRRDRNHPSVMAWSFCNEGGCNPPNADIIGLSFRHVSYDEDGFRPVTANMIPGIGLQLGSAIDVQGFSHQNGDKFDDFHKTFSTKPLIGSECCSCTTQRGEDVGNNTAFILGSFNANCNQQQTEWALDRKFVAGTMVWTLFDYYGEPAFGWPHISSSFGSIDLAGFAKASAYWYRSWWLYSDKKNQTTGGNDVTYNAPSLVNPGAKTSEDNPSDGYLIHIVQHWDPMQNGDSRTIQVYTNAPSAELFVNGVSQGVMKVDWQGWAEWDGVKYAPGNITANAITQAKLNAQPSVVASHTRQTAGTPTKVVAGLDVPNESTGTGSALVLDGQDTGMVNAAIIDSQGNLVNTASNNVTFTIVSGPGRIIGVGNGDPACHEPNKATWRSAYHGLARVIVQVTKDQASKPLHRKRLLQIDSEGGVRTTIVPPGVEEPLEDIIVEASVEGLGSSQVTIPVSTDADKDGVLSVAERWYKG